MGISRRKAGTMVKCPTCHAQVLVPPRESETAQQPHLAPPVGDVPAPLFERSDFEDFLQNPLPDKPAVPRASAPPPPPAPFTIDIPSSPSLAVPSGNAPAHPPGLLLSPAQATWLTVVVILLVALAFGAGLLVGHYWIG
jgi:hypothetical protein